MLSTVNKILFSSFFINGIALHHISKLHYRSLVDTIRQDTVIRLLSCYVFCYVMFCYLLAYSQTHRSK